MVWQNSKYQLTPRSRFLLESCVTLPEKMPESRMILHQVPFTSTYNFAWRSTIAILSVISAFPAACHFSLCMITLEIQQAFPTLSTSSNKILFFLRFVYTTLGSTCSFVFPKLRQVPSHHVFLQNVLKCECFSNNHQG